MGKNLVKKWEHLTLKTEQSNNAPKYVKPSTGKATKVVAERDDDGQIAKLGFVVEHKFRLTRNTRSHDGVKLYQIKAVRTFGDIEDDSYVVEGQLGGYVGGVTNLSHSGNCWIAQKACCYGDAQVKDDAWAMDYSVIKDRAVLKGRACLFDRAMMKGDSIAQDDVHVYNNLVVGGRAILEGDNKFRTFDDLEAYIKEKYNRRHGG